MLAVASLDLVSLEATKTTEGSSLCDALPNKTIWGGWWAVTVSVCRGGLLRILQQVVDPGTP